MSPKFSEDNVSYSGAMNTKFFSKFFLNTKTVLRTRANFTHVRFGEFSCGSRFSATCSFLLLTVSHIICWRAYKQMARSNTIRVVAFMANKHSFGNFTIYKFIRKTVCKKNLLSQANLSIAACIERAYPDPAMASYVDFLPKSLSKVLHVGRTVAGLGAKFLRNAFSFYSKGCFTVSTISCYFWSGHFVYTSNINNLARLG